MITGNPAGDADSIISAILYSYYLDFTYQDDELRNETKNRWRKGEIYQKRTTRGEQEMIRK